MQKKRNNIQANHALCYGLIITLLGSVSCTQKKEGLHTNQTTADTALKENVFSITKSHFESANMALGKLEMHTFYQTVKANGTIDVPPQNKASVSVYFGGYVKELTLLPGQKIKKGQLLFVLENPDYVQIQEDFLKAKGQLSYLKSNYERQANLVKDQVTSEKNYLKAKADYTVTQIKYKALKKKLNLMGINSEGLTRDNMRTKIVVKAPLSGYITKVNITKGIYLHPADVAVAITNTDHLHLELTIFEKDLNSVAIGQPIKFTVGQDETKQYNASVLLVNKYVDPEKRTINVHGHLEDKKNTAQFSPGMYIASEIYTASHTAPSLRQEAVVDIDNKHYVLAIVNETDSTYSFAQKKVKIVQSDNSYTEITNYKEFDANTQFVTKGAFELIIE